VREACCRNRYGGIWAADAGMRLWAMRRIQVSPGSHHERRRLGQQRQSEMSPDPRWVIAQGCGSSGSSHVVDLEGAEMVEIRLLSLSTLNARYQYRVGDERQYAGVVFGWRLMR
jgi:hypothetical protein